MIDPHRPPRTWTVAEADDALPLVQAVVGRARAALGAHVQRVADAGETASSNGHAGGAGAADVVRAAVAELEAMGVLFRDPGRGLVDFPAVTSGGRPYWLCWLDGETAVRWWHWVETGFAGRTSVDELPG